MLSGQKMPKKAEKWPKHPPNFFGGRLGSKLLQKKKAPFLPIGGRYLAEIVKKKGVLGDFEKAKFSKFSAKIGRKTTFVEKKFFSSFNN